MSLVQSDVDESELRQRIAQFKWYQPISFGRGLDAHAHGLPHLSQSHQAGLTKWRYIIERNLPDIQGMRVLDIGCNAGLFSIQLARCGAREVVGVDSERAWPGWQQQALFVKEALESRCQTTYNVQYVDCPMTDIPLADLGKFDLVMALCSLYYIPEDEMLRVLRHFYQQGCPTVLLQANKDRRTDSAEVKARSAPGFLLRLLKAAGYSHVTIDAPLFHSRPVLVGHLSWPPASPISRRDRVRRWLHRLF
jgi:2-polyprenyl-3-methyl-5-hydroxy-6-metoxy-1,4-benzoquinol methylase